MDKSAPSVAVAILNWNGKKFLEILLPALANLTYPNFAVYIIDNNSSDGSIQFVRQMHPAVSVIELDDNYGFAGGYNRGFSRMKEDYYLMMNSDVEVPLSFIEPMVEMLQADKTIAICQPKILSQSNPLMFEYAGAAGGMIDFIGYPFCRGRIFETVEAANDDYDSEKEIFWASGACCLIRREAYWKVGGMYEYYFMHSEEIDLCWRLIATGYKIMYCADSHIYHLGGGTLSYLAPRKTYLNFRNNIVMCFRNSPWHTNVWLLPARFVLDMAAAIRFLIRRDTANCMAVVKAYIGFLRWLLKRGNKYPEKKSLLSIPAVLLKSVVWQYYIKNKKHYSQIKK